MEFQAVQDESIHSHTARGVSIGGAGRRQRRIHTLPMSSKEVVMVVEVLKCVCLGCGKSLSNALATFCSKAWRASCSANCRSYSLQRAALESQ